jgi:hypothetical protein
MSSARATGKKARKPSTFKHEVLLSGAAYLPPHCSL